MFWRHSTQRKGLKQFLLVCKPTALSVIVRLLPSPMNQPPSLVVFIIVDPMSISGGDTSNLDRKVEPSLRLPGIVNELSVTLLRDGLDIYG